MRDLEPFPIVLAEIHRIQTKINSNNVNRENKQMEKFFSLFGSSRFLRYVKSNILVFTQHNCLTI
jgi:hypothetical protein